MLGSFLLPFLALSAYASSAHASLSNGGLSNADDKYILGNDDTDFARELARAGYPDLADGICKAIELSAGDDPIKKSAAELLRIDLQVDAVQRERDPKKRVNTLLEIVKAKESFGERNKGTELGDKVVRDLPELYRIVGEGVAAAIQGEEDPANAAKLRAEGSELFKRAERALNQKLSELENVDSGNVKEEIDFDDLLNGIADVEATGPAAQMKMLTLYGLIRTYYFHALLLDPADPEREILFNRSIQQFKEFQVDFSNELACYEGYVYEGLSYDGMGKSVEAVSAYESAIGVRELFDRGSNDVWLMTPEASDIVSWAVLQKMLAQRKLNDHKAAIATADDYLATTPEPYAAMKGLAVLVTKADACNDAQDAVALEATAKKLIEIDPQGLGGKKGREYLGLESGGGGKGFGFGESLRLVESAVGRSEFANAAAIAQRVLSASRGTAEAISAGASAALWLGVIHVQQDQLYEAVAAWEGGLERFPTSDLAPELLWRVSNGWIGLYAKDERKYFKDHWRASVDTLLAKFPKSSQAQQAALSEAKVLDAEQKFAEASAAYDKISTSSPVYGEALYRAGNALVNHIRSLMQKNSKADIKQIVLDAETRLKKARATLEQAAKDTLDLNAQARFAGYAFSARVSLGGLYLIVGVNRSEDALKLFERVESEYPGDSDKITAAWGLRIKAYQNLGKIDEAIAQLESQIVKDATARNISSAAAAIGRALDLRAIESLKTKGPSAAIDAQFQRAVKYYLLGIAPQIDGREALRVDVVEAVADRLFALGFQLNGVPETVNSFVDWTGKRKDTLTWTEAVRLYKAIVDLTPSYRTLIHLAQAQAFLGLHADAAASYANLFNRERFVDTVAKRLNEETLAAKPELLSAYIEYGVALRETGIGSRDEQVRTGNLERASGVFEAIVTSTARDSKIWWQSKFTQVQLLVDRGDYATAEIAIRSLQRSSDNYDGGRFGVQLKFEALEKQVAQKLPPKPGK
ncbi:MAG: hypothetical protein EXS13_07305 [Planctomycetes bacterium]|nr:hypothetical protein [Planctomycetota bacterium]